MGRHYWRRSTLLLLLTALLSGCTGIFFYPMSPWVQNPARQGLDYEDIILLHPDGLRLHGWWLPAQTEQVAGTVYFLHGNAQNISTHLMNVAWLPARGYQVFLLDYRGYGLSEGKPRLPEAMADIQLGLDWLRASGRVQGPLVVFGQSLGASMTIPVLAADKGQAPDCAMFEAGFTSFRGITTDIMRRSWLLWPFSFVVAPTIPKQWDAADHIAALSPMPLLILHSRDDSIIPFREGEALYAAAAQPKQFQALLGEHIAAGRDESVRDRLVQFMEDACGAQSLPEPAG